MKAPAFPKAVIIPVLLAATATLGMAKSKPELLCHPVQGTNGMMMYLSFPSVTLARDRPEFIGPDPRLFGGRVCYEVIQGETAIVFDGYYVEMSVEGDICGPSPRFFIYGVDDRYNLYPAYLESGEWTPDPMAPRVASAVAVVKRRCGGLPDEIHFVARSRKRGISYGRDRPRTVNPTPWFDVLYSSRLVKENTRYRLISDDPEWEEQHFSQMRASVDSRARMRRENDLNNAIGEFIGLLMFGGRLP